jgi:hypothetical protein
VVLAEAIASSWRPRRIEVAAFRRGAAAEVVLFAPFEPDRWIDGGDQIEWTLEKLDHLSVDVPDTIDCDCAPDCGDATPPARRPPRQPIGQRPRLPRPRKPSKVPTIGTEGPRGRSKTVRSGPHSDRPPEVETR